MVDKSLVNYEYHRQHMERQNGCHDPGALGISGWKGCTWAGLVWMYTHGKVSKDKAEEVRGYLAARGIKAAIKGFKVKDHIAHDEACGRYAPEVTVRTSRAKQVRSRIEEIEAELAKLRAECK